MTSSRAVLDRARENGQLNAGHPSREEILRDYGFWCWKLRIPMVCYERNTPRSRHGSVTLDLFTTRYLLTPRGLDELQALADKLRIPASVTVSRYDALWQEVPKSSLEDLARAVFRTATRFGNFELRPAGPSPELAQLIAAIHGTADVEAVRVA
jgi:hypothetical protein